MTERPRPVPILDAVLVGVVSSLFTGIGAWMVVGGRAKDRETGLAIAAFFGLCLGVSVWVLRERLARRRALAARAVEIVGSVPFRARVWRQALLLAVAAAVLALVAVAAAPSARGVSALAWAFAALCGVLAPVVLVGPPGRRAVVFEPEGLRLVEPGYELSVPWDEIAGARLRDIHDTLLVELAVRDPGALAPVPSGRRGDPAGARRRLARSMTLTRRVCGCDLSVGPALYGLDPVLFLRAIETYVSDPAARAGLAPRPALEAARAR